MQHEWNNSTVMQRVHSIKQILILMHALVPWITPRFHNPAKDMLLAPWAISVTLTDHFSHHERRHDLHMED